MNFSLLLYDCPNAYTKLSDIVTEAPTLEAVDHLKQFEQYVLSYIGDTNVIREELFNVMR